MSSESPVIDVRGVAKRYEVYATPRDRLRQMLWAPGRALLGLAKRDYFKEFWALKDIGFQVRRGETVAIIGQNGSGKSTLLQIVCGTLPPTSGETRIAGRIAALLELGAGFNPEFSGRENVYLSGLLYGIEAKELALRFDSIVEFAEISAFIDQPVKTYSSGMYVRLAFAIAAHVDADVLVIDEALSVGDVRFTQKCMRYLRKFQETGTLLFVSHDTSAVISLCSRAIWIDGGCMRMDGPAKQTVEAYLAVQHARDREAIGHRVNVDAVAESAPDTASQSGETVAVDRTGEVAAPPIESAVQAQPDFAGAGFGARGATIVGAQLVGEDGRPLTLSHGGELAALMIRVVAHRRLESLIFGFDLKDRLGQRLFGENSFRTYQDRPICAAVSETFIAKFWFRMPILPAGIYSFDLAVATGSQDDHTQEHWLHDALELRTSDRSVHGLIGIPMLEISVEKMVND